MKVKSNKEIVESSYQQTNNNPGIRFHIHQLSPCYRNSSIQPISSLSDYQQTTMHIPPTVVNCAATLMALPDVEFLLILRSTNGSATMGSMDLSVGRDILWEKLSSPASGTNIRHLYLDSTVPTWTISQCHQSGHPGSTRLTPTSKTSQMTVNIKQISQYRRLGAWTWWS